MKWNEKDVSFALACIFNSYHSVAALVIRAGHRLFCLSARKHAGCVFVVIFYSLIYTFNVQLIWFFLCRTHQHFTYILTFLL